MYASFIYYKNLQAQLWPFTRPISSSTINFYLPRNQCPYCTWQPLLAANRRRQLVRVSLSLESYTTDNWQCKHNSDLSPDLFIHHQLLPATKSTSIPYMTTAARGQASNGMCLFVIGADNWQRLRSLTYLSFKIYRNTAFCHLFLHNHPSTSPVSTPIMHDLYFVCRLSLARNSPQNDVSLLYFILSSFTNLFLDD